MISCQVQLNLVSYFFFCFGLVDFIVCEWFMPAALAVPLLKTCLLTPFLLTCRKWVIACQVSPVSSYCSESHSGSVELAGCEQFFVARFSYVFFHNLYTQTGPVGFIECGWLHVQPSYDCFYDISCLLGSIALILGCEWLYSKSSCIFSHSHYQFLL